MPIEEAVLDAPVLDTPSLEPEPEGGEPESTEPETPAEGQEDQPKPGEATPTPADPKQLHQDVRKHIAETRAKNPALADEIKSAYYLKNDLKKEGFSNIAEVRAFKEAYTALGEPEKIQESMGELGWFKEMDSEFTAANPQIWDRISDAAPEQFVKLYPAMAEKVEGMAPDAFASWFSNRAIADFDQFGLRQDISWLLRIAGENAEVKEIADKFTKYFERLGAFASKPFAAPKGTPKPAGEQPAAENTERIELFRTVNTSAARNEYTSELTKQLAGRKLSDVQRNAVAELVASALTRAESADDKKKIDRYYAANDRNGYLQYKKGIRDRSLAKAVESALAATIGRAAAPKPAAIAPKTANGRPAPQAQQGIKQVTQEPARNTVKWGRGGTSPEDVIKGIYTLTDGSKVQWRG